MDFSWIIPKLGSYICLLVPYNSANFQLDQSMNSQVTAVFVLAQKKTENFGLLYVRNDWHDFLQIGDVRSLPL